MRDNLSRKLWEIFWRLRKERAAAAQAIKDRCLEEVTFALATKGWVRLEQEEVGIEGSLTMIHPIKETFGGPRVPSILQQISRKAARERYR